MKADLLHTSFPDYHRFSTIADITPALADGIFLVGMLLLIAAQIGTFVPSSNDAAHGQAFGPPTPPRDGLPHIGDFSEVFDFSQDSNYHPYLPSL